MVTGISALLISLSNYFRDRARIIVELKRSTASVANDLLHIEEVLILHIRNSGRRPVYITSVGFEWGKRWNTCITFTNSIEDRKIGEGDAPVTIVLPRPDEVGFSQITYNSRAFVVDHTGKKYVSNPICKAKVEVFLLSPEHITYIDFPNLVWEKHAVGIMQLKRN